MPTRTHSTTVFSSCEEVYRFLADIENIPKWAPGFCERLELGHHGWWAYTPQGEMTVELETAEGEDGAGVIHLQVGPSADKLGFIVMRVFPLARKRTRVIFTLIQPPEWAHSPGGGQGELLLAEMQGLIRCFGGGELHGPEISLPMPALGLN